MLAALLALALPAQAAKIDATVNIGIGPTVGWMANPGEDLWSRSVGVALVAEGYVDKKTLRSKKVMKRVPKKYRGFVKKMEDAHVVPLPAMLVPDAVMVAPLGDEDVDVLPVSWAPLEVAFIHNTKGPHSTLSLQLRGSWLRVTDAEDNSGNAAWIGITAAPEIQTSYEHKVGLALGGHAGPGYATIPDGVDEGYARPWLDMGVYTRLQMRFPIKVKL